MRVRVFWNITRGCWSIWAKNAAGAWRLSSHAETVHLRNVLFHVGQGARRRVVASGKKTVHAWLEGELSEGCFALAGEHGVYEIKYNPRLAGYFTSDQNCEPSTRPAARSASIAFMGYNRQVLAREARFSQARKDETL